MDSLKINPTSGKNKNHLDALEIKVKVFKSN